MRTQADIASVKHNNDLIMKTDMLDIITDRDAEASHSDDRARWSRTLDRWRRQVDNLNASNVYIPVNVSTSGGNVKDHWILIHVNKMHNKMYLYDSMGHPEQYVQKSEQVKTWWTSQDGEQQRPQVDLTVKTVMQADGYNCGLTAAAAC